MCSDCWAEHGSPSLDSPKIRRAVDLIRLIYETEITGGVLHVELDDWNIEDHFWTPYEPGREYLVDPAKWDVSVELADLMKSMTVAERASALARERGYIPD